jgi:hypothetical protein
MDTASMANRDDLAVLEAENSRLIALLDAHGIEWRRRSQTAVVLESRSRPGFPHG